MFKTLTKITAVIVLISALLLFGCSGDFKVAGGPSAGDVVTSNGGLAVKKGEYLYFINGTATTSDDNKFGNAVKGSIVRINLNDTSDKVVIVPKIVLSSYFDGGFYIFGNKIYYTSPSVEKDKDGNVLTTYLDYFSVNLDGSGTVRIMTTVSNSKAYKFFEKDGNVYVLFIATANSSDTADKIYLVDTVKGISSKTCILSSYTNTPIFAGDGYIYFNQDIFIDKNGNGIIDAEETNKENYNKFARMSFAGGAIEDITLSGGTTIVNNKYTVTLTDAKIFGDKTTVYYTKKSAEGISDPVVWSDPFSVSYTIGDAAEKIIVASSTDNSFDFTGRMYDSPTSFFGVMTNLFYVTNDYSNNDITLHSIELMPNPTKLLFTQGNFVYYLNTDTDNIANALFKKQFKGASNEDLSMVLGTQVLTDVSFNTVGLMPELIDDYLYFIRSDGDYTSYLYRVSIGGNTEAAAELVSKIAEKDKVD